MVGQPEEPLDAQKSVPLKLSEPVVDSTNPWADDLLARQVIAAWLTNIVAIEKAPMAISLHGQWGTGKTFMLKRWQKELENLTFRAIYFNAWEDDFCDDPLLAILGQLAGHFKEGTLRTLAGQVLSTALPLLRANALGVLSKTTGLTVEFDREERRNLVEEYLHQRATKDELKQDLTRMAAIVVRETGHPLVFIVDELDRCRPTFAIELLERVKHIFDVPNMVFVFGLNRDELSKALSAVYGDINTDVYLRRFFDFEFNLQEVDSQGFAERLIDRFQLVQVFQSLSDKARDRVHVDDYDNFRAVLPKLWSALGLSLRDIDYGIRLLALLARSVRPQTPTHPYLLAILIAMKFKDQEIYRSLVTSNFRTSEVMDYIDGELRQDLVDDNLTRYLDRSEGFLYCTDLANPRDRVVGQAALERLSPGAIPTPGETSGVVSGRALRADQEQRDRLTRAIYDGRWVGLNHRVLAHLATLVDTYQTQLRR